MRGDYGLRVLYSLRHNIIVSLVKVEIEIKGEGQRQETQEVSITL